jgi:hypothetical protein
MFSYGKQRDQMKFAPLIAETFAKAKPIGQEWICYDSVTPEGSANDAGLYELSR